MVIVFRSMLSQTYGQQNNVNSIKIVEKIPGAWLIQIKDAGHAVMGQYPDKINRVLETFLSTTTNSPS